jgi:pyruvate formate lyase activating enzyme
MDGRELKVTETIGKEYSVEELIQIIEKDRVFFEESGGGVTFSGGEPMLQFDFLLKVLQECQQRDIHTCVDTTGHISQVKMERVAQYTDLFLYDLKHMDDALHRKYTGVGNKLILDNLQRLDAMGKEVWVRYPLIPGFNDEEGNLLNMLAFLQKLKRQPKVSILPYHKIGSHKYHRFGLEYKMNGVEEPVKEHVNEVVALFSAAGYSVTVGG